MIIRKNDFKYRELENKEDPSKNVKVYNFDSASEMKNCRMLAQVVIPVGGEIYYHEHLNECEYYIITEGVGLVQDGNESYEVTASDVIKTPSEHSHGIKNIGNVDLKFIAVIITY